MSVITVLRDCDEILFYTTGLAGPGGVPRALWRLTQWVNTVLVRKHITINIYP